MDFVTQGESSEPPVQPPKRKRGRPRKDASLEAVEVNKEVPLRMRGPKPTIGQEVICIMEAEFESGYLISVKIGKSNMRGVVFKPRHCVPVTAENDVAPLLPMIKRRKNRKIASERPSDQPETSHVDADVEMVEPWSILPLSQALVDETAPGM